MTDTIQTPIGTISVGSTVLEGERMYGDRTSGVVRKIIPGVGFVVDNGVLFRSFATATAAATSTAAEEQEMQGLRCGFDPLPIGYPDCDFWVGVDGVEPLYVATEYDYGKADTPPSPTEMLAFLDQSCMDALRVGGATLAAWNRQRDFVKGMHLGATGSATCRRLGYVAHPGISHGFARPDPVMTRQETRCYLVEEFKRFMEGRIQGEAVRLAAVPDLVDDATIDLGSFPAGRLYRLVGRLGSAVPAVALDEQIRYVVRWVVGVVTCHLADPDAIITSLESDALAFWKVDRLVCGKTIDSFWNHSPFEALRAAPPLSPGIEDEAAEDDVDEDTETDTESETDTETDTETEEIEEIEEIEEEDSEAEDDEDDRLQPSEGPEYAVITYTHTSLPIWIPMVLSVIITVVLAILCSKR